MSLVTVFCVLYKFYIKNLNFTNRENPVKHRTLLGIAKFFEEFSNFFAKTY
jgi:hypothetical protein